MLNMTVPPSLLQTGQHACAGLMLWLLNVFAQIRVTGNWRRQSLKAFKL